MNIIFVFLSRENNIYIFEPPCNTINVLFIIWTKMKRNSIRTDNRIFSNRIFVKN